MWSDSSFVCLHLVRFCTIFIHFLSSFFLRQPLRNILLYVRTVISQAGQYTWALVAGRWRLHLLTLIHLTSPLLAVGVVCQSVYRVVVSLSNVSASIPIIAICNVPTIASSIVVIFVAYIFFFVNSFKDICNFCGIALAFRIPLFYQYNITTIEDSLIFSK